MSIRIILVDDHALVREGIARLLDGQQDMRVIASFGAGREAIRYVEREEADVAVLDVAMPDLNGIELARYLQDASPGMRIVMLSMHADVEYVHRALLAGAQGYVLKDCPGRILLEAVRTVHAGRRYVCEQVGPQALEQYVRDRGITDPLDRLPEPTLLHGRAAPREPLKNSATPMRSIAVKYNSL